MIILSYRIAAIFYVYNMPYYTALFYTRGSRGCIDGWMDEWIGDGLGGWMNGRMDECVGEWVNKWMSE